MEAEEASASGEDAGLPGEADSGICGRAFDHAPMAEEAPGLSPAGLMHTGSAADIVVPSFDEAEDFAGEPSTVLSSAIDGVSTSMDELRSEEAPPDGDGEDEPEQPSLPPLLVALDVPRAFGEEPTRITLQWAPPLLQFDEPPDGLGSQQPYEMPDYSVEYELQYAHFNPDEPISSLRWQTCYRGPDTRAQVGDLNRGRLYAFRVGCTLHSDAFGGPTPEYLSTHVLAATVATPPSGVHPPALSSRQRNSFKFKWAPPDSDGGRPLLSYALFMRPPPQDFQGRFDAEGFAEVYVGLEPTCKVVKLKPGQRYMARVQCSNELGLSELSRAMEALTQSSVPCPPDEPVAANVAAESATLCWAAPYDNGDPVTDFVLERDDGLGSAFGPVYTGPLTECRLQGLQSGRVYRFRLAAYNSVGVSKWSPTCEVKTGLATSKAPRRARVIGVNSTLVTLRWEPPEDTGGGEVQCYEAELRPKSRAAIENGLPDEWVLIYQGNSAATTVGGLKPGCTYQVRLRAHTPAGYGEFSTPLDIRTAADKPHAPASLSVSPLGQTSLSLSWQPPSHDGGSPVTSYRVQLWEREAAQQQQQGGGGRAANSMAPGFAAGLFQQPEPPPGPPGGSGESVYQGPSRECVVDGLMPGRQYGVWVHATNDRGAGPWCVPVYGRTRPGQPLQPELRRDALAATASGLSLSWQEPFGQGAAVSGYTLQLAEEQAWLQNQEQQRREAAAVAAAAAAAAAQPQQQGNGLNGTAPPPGTVLPNGSSHEPAAAAAAPAGVPPAAVANGVGHAGQQQQQQGMASSDGHSSDADSQAQQQDGSHVFRTVYQGSAPKAVISGLQPFMRYVLRLRAANSAGNSRWSTPLIARTEPSVPSEPLQLSAIAESSSLALVSWQPPASCHGAPVTSYTVEAAAVPSRSKVHPHWTRAYQGPATQCAVQGLAPGRLYAFRVRAANSQGHGEWAPEVQAATLASPPGPPGPPAFSQRTSNAVRVRWAPPQEDGGASVNEYSLEMAGEALPGFVMVYRGGDTSTKVTGLDAGVRYMFRVQAISSAGEGPYSASISVVTARPPPGPPCSVAVEPIIPTAVGDGDGETSVSGSPPGLGVSWQPPMLSGASAEVAGYEVEAVVVADGPSASSASSSLVSSLAQQSGSRHVASVSARLNGWQLQPAHAGACYRVRVRSIGSDGSGHGVWSDPVTCELPRAAPEQALASSASAAAAGSAAGGGQIVVAGGSGSRRRGKKAAAAVAAASALSGDDSESSGTRGFHHHHHHGSRKELLVGQRSAAAKRPTRNQGLFGMTLRQQYSAERWLFLFLALVSFTIAWAMASWPGLSFVVVLAGFVFILFRIYRWGKVLAR